MNAPKSVPKNKIKAGINLNPKIIKIGAAQAPEIPHPKPKKVPPTRVLIKPFFFKKRSRSTISTPLLYNFCLDISVYIKS